MALGAQQAISQAGLARKLGMSQCTVSLALQNSPRISEETRQRVVGVARELGYRPNAAARSTRIGRFDTLALLQGTRQERSSLPEGVLAGIHDVMQAQNLHLMLVRLADEQLSDRKYIPRILQEAASDGLIIDYTHGCPAQMDKLIESHRVPAIWMNRKRASDCVHPDDHAAAREATEHLLSLGHRRIAYVDYTHGPDYDAPHYSAVDRRAGYEQAMREAGLAPRVVTASRGWDVRARERVAAARELLRAADRPTAVLGYGSAEIEPLFLAATAVGLAVPRDLSMICFAADPIKWMGPHVTIMQTPDRLIGRRASERLLEKIARPGTAREPAALPFTLYPGQTCTPPPSPDSGAG